MPWFEHEFDRKKSFKRIVQKTAFPEVAPEVKMSSENNSRWSFCSSKNSQDAMKYIWDRYISHIFSQKSDILRLLLLEKYEKVLYCEKSADNYANMSQFSAETFSKRIYSCKLTFTALQSFVISKSSHV